MKKFLLFILFVVCVQITNAQSAFTPGNLVVLRYGDGLPALTSAAATVSLVEYTPSGILVQTISVPSTGTDKLTASGSATSEGGLTLSGDGRYLSFIGYDAIAGTASIAGTSSNKVVARVGTNGVVDLTTKIPNADISGNNPRGAVTMDGTGFWVCGAAGGVRYVPFGNPASTNSIQLTTPLVNTRIPQIFNKQVYITASTISGQTVCSVATLGTGLPTSGTQTVTVLSGLPTTTASGSPYAFYFFDLTDAVVGYDVVYIADQASTGGAGLRKYSLVSGTWTLNNTISPTGGSGITGLTGAVNSSGNVVLYATFSNTANNAIHVLTDGGGYNANNNGTFSPIVSAGGNYVFRGLAFAPSAFTWTGTTSSDWNTSSNWTSAGIPTASASPISIPVVGTNYPVITSNTFVSNLSIEPGANISVTGASVSLRSITQPLTLKSNNTGTGRIGNSTGTVTGNVTVQRYIPGGRRTSRFLGHPFSGNLTMSSLIDNIYVTGDGTTAGTGGATPGTGFDATATNAASSFWFSNPLQAWTAFTTTGDASWTQYRGIRVLVRGDRTQTTTITSATPPAPLAVTLDMTGTLNTGAQNVSVPTGFSVLGNPYPSPVDLGTRLSATANIGTQFWYWDANAGPSAGAYRTKLVGSAASLPMNGAFVVQPTAAASIAFVESDKTATDTTTMFRTNTQSGVLELQVLYNNYPADNMFIRFSNTSNDNKDALDGEKLSNTEVNFYALSADNKKLSLDTRPFADNKIIPLGFTATAANSFKIKVADYGINEDTYLKDKFLNTLTKLDATTEYNFSVDPSIPATLGENRFEIMMKTNSALPTTILNVTAAQKNAGIEVSWTTANETNMSNYEVEESTDGNTFSKATSIAANNATTNTYNWFDGNIINGDNYYRIKAVEKNGTAKYSNVVKVKIGGKGAGFTVYPNPIKGGVVSLQMSNIERGIYTVRIINNIGQEVANKTINHAGGGATQTIDLGKSIATGTYNMQITNGTTIITKTVIVE